MVAAMTEALEPTPEDRVLEVGTGSGYQTAVLAELVAEVYTVERIPELSEDARRVLEQLGYDTIHYRVGDGSLGWPEEAPFDGILVTAAASKVPEPLKEQIAQGRTIVIPVGGHGMQDLYRIRRVGREYRREFITSCRFVPLIREG